MHVQAWEVHALLAAGIASGEVVPLPLNRFERKEAGNAFRFMAAGALFNSCMLTQPALATLLGLSQAPASVPLRSRHNIWQIQSRFHCDERCSARLQAPTWARC